MLKWFKRLFSGSNKKVDVKSVLSASVSGIAILMYAAYGVKGLMVHWDMPTSIRDITVALIVGGLAGATSTLWNHNRDTDDAKEEAEEKKDTAG